MLEYLHSFATRVVLNMKIGLNIQVCRKRYLDKIERRIVPSVNIKHMYH